MKKLLAGLMHGRAGRPITLTRRRKMMALGVAGVSDLVQLVFAPVFWEGGGSPLDVALDVVTALLVLIIVGFEWRLALALAVELVPGLDLFPTWTAVVLSMPALAKPPSSLPPAEAAAPTGSPSDPDATAAPAAPPEEGGTARASYPPT